MPKIGNIVYKLIRNNVDDQKNRNYGRNDASYNMRQNVWFKVDFMDLSEITKRLEQDDKKSMIL